MLIAGLGITFLSWIVYFVKKDLFSALLTFFTLIMVYVLLVYKVMIETFFSTNNLTAIVYSIGSVIAVIMIKNYMDKFIKNEVGYDIRTLIMSLFPNRYLRLYALFFAGQLVYVSDPIIGLLLIYFIGKMLGIKRVLIFCVGYLSLIINMLFDLIYQIKYFSEISTAQIQYATYESYIFLLATMLLSFIFIISISLFVDHKNIKDVTVVVKKDRFELIGIVIGYFVIISTSTLLFDINVAQTITSVAMLMLISTVSRMSLHNVDEALEEIEKQMPYIFSILIIFFNGVFIYILDQNLFLGLALIFSFNTFVFQRAFQKVDAINVVEKDNDNFAYKVIFVYALYLILDVFILNSAINNSAFGISIMDNIVIYLSQATNMSQIAYFIFGLSPFSFIITNFLDFNLNLSYEFTLIMIYAWTIFGSLNLFYFYIIHELLGIKDRAMKNCIIAISAFMLIEVIIMIIIVTIL
ncbi:MAG: hypothetical protein ACRC5R_06255 [Mycoplasmatales bacterium]